jgi:alkanesulfonate monooxygenase SsuD/methylene tetrahydromethanopterin reductase-like flavin-dependent oxidoreductase (luciferase family)
MSDYGNDLRFGYFLPPTSDDVPALTRRALAAEAAGLDLIGVQDHPYHAGHVDTWTLIAYLGGRTERIRFFPDVANLPLRPPAVLAKSVATLDLLTGGRVELGLGAGGFWDAIAAYGGPSRSPGEAVAATREAIAVIRHVWGQQRNPRFAGDHYRLDGARPGPLPAHDIGIWVGATGPRMLRLIGELADGWVPSSFYVSPERLPAMQARIDAAALEAGREPAAVRRLYNVGGRITDGASEGFLHGPASQWVDELTALALEHGMDTFVLAPPADDELQVRRFGEDVVPLVRAEVARARGR